MDYQAAVAEAAAALRRGDEADWELARLTWEHTRSNVGQREQPDKVSMSQWCDDVRKQSGRRYSDSTGYLYRHAWDRHGYLSETGKLPPFNEVLREIDPNSRDSATVQARVDAAAVEKLLSAGTPEAKRAVFERLQADPAVVSPAITLLPEPEPDDAGAALTTTPARPEPVTVAQGALRLAVFVLDARVAAQHYAQALGESDLDPAGREAEAAAIDTVLHAWERLRLILHAPGGIRLVREVEDFLTEARA